MFLHLSTTNGECLALPLSYIHRLKCFSSCPPTVRIFHTEISSLHVYAPSPWETHANLLLQSTSSTPGHLVGLGVSAAQWVQGQEWDAKCLSLQCPILGEHLSQTLSLGLEVRNASLIPQGQELSFLGGHLLPYTLMVAWGGGQLLWLPDQI